MSKYIHPLTPEVALEVASNLRPDDFREISEGYGLDPKVYLPIMAQTPSGVYFTSPSGKIAGMAGVGQQGDIWMLCTPVIYEKPILFAREAKRYVDCNNDKLCVLKVHYRNKVHLKLLKFLGFKFLRKFEWGPNNVTFIEFCRVRRR